MELHCVMKNKNVQLYVNTNVLLSLQALSADNDYLIIRSVVGSLKYASSSLFLCKMTVAKLRFKL